MSLYKTVGVLMLGSRLKRISTYFLGEMNKVYQDLGLPFEATWFGIFYYLRQHGRCSIKDLSEVLEVSHSAMSQTVKSLINKELLTYQSNESDARAKELRLTEAGEKLLEQLLPVWENMERQIKELMENEVSPNFLPELDKLENALYQHTLSQRIKENQDV